MFVLVTLIIASFGSLITGSATSSTDTLRRPCQVTAFTSASRLMPYVLCLAKRCWSDASQPAAPSAACPRPRPTTHSSRSRPAGSQEMQSQRRSREHRRVDRAGWPSRSWFRGSSSSWPVIGVAISPGATGRTQAQREPQSRATAPAPLHAMTDTAPQKSDDEPVLPRP